MLFLYVLLSVVNLDCFHAQPVTTELSGTLSLNAMNNNQILTGQFDGSSNEMIVWANGEIVTRVTQFNESYGVLINKNGVAAGLGSNGISQDDKLIIANAFGEFDVVATITGTAGTEAVIFRKPVLSFGEHQAINALPTVRFANNYRSTVLGLNELLDMDPKANHFELSRRAYFFKKP